MFTTPDSVLPAHPRKLILLSADPTEAKFLSEYLKAEDQNKYEFKHVDALKELQAIELEAVCHAVLLDIRRGYAEATQSIKWIGELQSRIALICLCRSHKQLQHYKALIHLIDDYILADNLPEGELSTRISHAIRRRQKEYKLLHEQDLLQSLLENIPDAIYFKDRKSRFTKVNKAMAQSCGHTVDSLIGKSDFDLFTTEHASPAFEDEHKIIETGAPIIGKLEKETFDDGSSKWVSTTKVPLRDQRQRIIGTMGISRDISEMKKVQDNLKEEHRLLSAILNNVPDRIFVKDRYGRYIGSNRLHQKFLGASSEEEVLGKTLYDFSPRERADKYFNEDMEIIRTGIGLINSEESRQHTDGSIVWYLTSKVPLIDEAGNCVGIVGISRDVTTQKENEEKLRKTIEILHDTQLQLIEAEKLKTVGRLSAGVAHEVKNPLSVVSLGVEYLLTKINEPEELVQIIDDMKTAVEKANAVIFQLLDYSSPHEVTTDPKNLNLIIKQVLAMLRHNFKKAKVKVETDLEEALPMVAFDTQKMEQVLINLFLNAIAAMDNGGTLGIRSYSQRMKSTGSNLSGEMTGLFKVGDRIVTLEIADTGSGIESKSADKLFDPFYSTKSTGE
ncbi:MAG: PAS domain S-box protein, partial [Opitutales bacterium]